MPPRLDPDDSFHDRSTKLCWVLGLGVEAPLADGWTWRLDGSYLGFGRGTHRAQPLRKQPVRSRRSPGGLAPTGWRTHLVIVRLAVIRRFDLWR